MKNNTNRDDLIFHDALPHVGVARIFDWRGEANHKSHAMTSSEIFKKGNFCWAKVS